MTPLALLNRLENCRGPSPRPRCIAVRDGAVVLPIRLVDGCAPEQDKLIRQRAQQDRLLALRRRIEHLRRLITEDQKAQQAPADD